MGTCRERLLYLVEGVAPEEIARRQQVADCDLKHGGPHVIRATARCRRRQRRDHFPIRGPVSRYLVSLADGVIDDAVAQVAAEALERRKRATATTRCLELFRVWAGLLVDLSPRSPGRERSTDGGTAPLLFGSVAGEAGEPVHSRRDRRPFCRRQSMPGRCELPIDSIAATAGTSRSVR